MSGSPYSKKTLPGAALLPGKRPLTWDNGRVITPVQVPVPSGSAVPLGLVPPAAQAALSVPGGTVYVGTGVTTSTGTPLTGYALLPPNPPSGTPVQLYAISASGTVTAGMILSTPAVSARYAARRRRLPNACPAARTPHTPHITGSASPSPSLCPGRHVTGPPGSHTDLRPNQSSSARRTPFASSLRTAWRTDSASDTVTSLHAPGQSHRSPRPLRGDASDRRR